MQLDRETGGSFATWLCLLCVCVYTIDFENKKVTHPSGRRYGVQQCHPGGVPVQSGGLGPEQ